MWFNNLFLTLTGRLETFCKIKVTQTLQMIKCKNCNSPSVVRTVWLNTHRHEEWRWMDFCRGGKYRRSFRCQSAEFWWFLWRRCRVSVHPQNEKRVLRTVYLDLFGHRYCNVCRSDRRKPPDDLSSSQTSVSRCSPWCWWSRATWRHFLPPRWRQPTLEENTTS